LIDKLETINGPRTVVADIETFPMEGYFWRLFKQNIGVEQIKEPTSFMSVTIKVLGYKETYYKDQQGVDPIRDDEELTRELHDILSHVDIVIAHNGEKFDMRVIRARMAMHHLDPLPPIKVIDTFLQNRKQFEFDSQRLAFVSKYFSSQEKDDHARFPGFKLWLECLADNHLAWKDCKKYNILDVLSDEEVYLELRGWYQGAANFGPYVTVNNDDERVCPICGGTHVEKRGTKKTQVGIYPQFHCIDCGAWSRGRLMSVTKEDRQHILVN